MKKDFKRIAEWRCVSLMTVVWLVGLATFIFGFVVNTQAQEEENRGPNTNIVRWAKGTYLYRGISDGRERGTEDWTLTVHPDGSRTMRMWNDLYARNGHLTATLRVAQDFRPIEAYVSYWTQGQFKGSGMFAVNGRTLEAITNGPQGRINETIEVPEGFSIVTHPLAGDGWHTWYYDRVQGGEQTGSIYNIDSMPDLTKPTIGKLEPQALEFIGEETIKVPAGTFDATHFLIGGVGDVWTMDPDSILVKFSWEQFGLEYVLASYSSGEGHQR
jgi:hypothetical protein